MTAPKLGTNRVMQGGVIVRDIESTARAWSEILGLPMPEIIVTNTVEKTRAEYKGRPTSARAKLAFFHMGQLDVELIERIDGPTAGLSLRRKLCEVIFPFTTGLKTSPAQLIAPVAALLAPVRYLEDPLGVYRIHGSNLWSVTQGRLEQADGTYRAAGYVLVTEEKVAHANEVLRRAGRSVRLSPVLRYRYIERYCQVHAVSPLSCLPGISQALRAENGWGRLQTVLWVHGFVRRILKHYLRR